MQPEGPLAQRVVDSERRLGKQFLACQPAYRLCYHVPPCPSGASALSTVERVERRLTAILAADVVGYSRLTEVDEEGTHDNLKLTIGATTTAN